MLGLLLACLYSLTCALYWTLIGVTIDLPEDIPSFTQFLAVLLLCGNALLIRFPSAPLHLCCVFLLFRIHTSILVNRFAHCAVLKPCHHYIIFYIHVRLLPRFASTILCHPIHCLDACFWLLDLVVNLMLWLKISFGWLNRTRILISHAHHYLYFLVPLLIFHMYVPLMVLFNTMVLPLWRGLVLQFINRTFVYYKLRSLLDPEMLNVQRP